MTRVGPGQRTQRLLSVASILVAVATLVVLFYIAVATANTAQDLRASSALLQREIRHIQRAQHYQAHQIQETRRILCESNLASLVILKAIKNTAGQQGLVTAGIPDHLPPIVEAVCA